MHDFMSDLRYIYMNILNIFIILNNVRHHLYLPKERRLCIELTYPYTYTYTSTYAYIYTYTDIHIQLIHIPLDLPLNICIQIYMYRYTYTYTLYGSKAYGTRLSFGKRRPSAFLVQGGIVYEIISYTI